MSEPLAYKRAEPLTDSQKLANKLRHAIGKEKQAATRCKNCKDKLVYLGANIWWHSKTLSQSCGAK